MGDLLGVALECREDFSSSVVGVFVVDLDNLVVSAGDELAGECRRDGEGVDA